jgi:hypothetical protein
MKKKILITQAIFFISLSLINFIFYPKSEIGVERLFIPPNKIQELLELFLLLGVSFLMCRFILESPRMLRTSLGIGLSLWILFEISKCLEHLLGFLPNYLDVPIIITISISLLAICVYVSVLYLICFVIKTIKKSKIN